MKIYKYPLEITDRQVILTGVEAPKWEVQKIGTFQIRKLRETVEP